MVNFTSNAYISDHWRITPGDLKAIKSDDYIIKYIFQE